MKKKKLLAIATTLTAASVVLSGCVQRTSSGKPYGFVYDHMAVPTQHFLVWLSNLMGGSLGWAIILLTFVVRLILMPVMLKQSRNATIQQEKISHLKPLMDDIAKRQQAAQTDAEKMAISQELMSLYRDNGISMTGGIGCLPLLIQMPIFAALYAAIQYSPELSKSYFYGINLGHSSIILTILSFAAYALQGWLSMLGMPKEQRKQMQMMMFM
ncbi:MAG: membrane protein insertase YidC, partial [Ligilactobacillus ruminis]|nr:membrane protein insertase YidC [Ligilactobacillus ruminis]